MLRDVPSRQRLKLTTGGRFDPETTANRLESLRVLADVSPKELGSVLWPNQSPDDAARAWYKRTPSKEPGRKKKRILPLTLPEIERAVDYLCSEAYRRKAIPVRNLPGFPFIDFYVSIHVAKGE
jgi:hypothetical protein